MIALVHHADAVGAEIDPQRPLSLAGRAHAEGLAARAQGRGIKPVVIWHSGKLRARQTGEAFWRICNPFAEFSAIHGLQPSDPPLWIADRLAGETRDVMLVGHMPSLPRILALLVTGRDEHEIAFPQHGMVVLRAEGDRWVETERIV